MFKLSFWFIWFDPSPCFLLICPALLEMLEFELFSERIGRGRRGLSYTSFIVNLGLLAGRIERRCEHNVSLVAYGGRTGSH